MKKIILSLVLITSFLPLKVCAGDWSFGGAIELKREDCHKNCRQYADNIDALTPYFFEAVQNGNEGVATQLQAEINKELKKLNDCEKSENKKKKKKKGFWNKLTNGLKVVGFVVAVSVAF